MSLAQITGLSLVELVGDIGAQSFANNGGIKNLGIGIAGYIGVFIMLIINLQGSTLLMVNGAWDGINNIIISLYAYFILGERFKNISQYIGLIFIVFGIYLLNIPLKNNHIFKWPSLFGN